MFIINKLRNVLLKRKRLPYLSEISLVFRRNFFKSEVMPLPTFVQIEPTTKCNLECKFCSRHSLNKSRLNKDLNLEQFEYILSKIPTLKKIKLQGLGEPLLNKEISKILNVAKDSKKIISLISNGLMFKKVDIDPLLQILDCFYISIDSLDLSSFSEIRGGASLKEVIENIDFIIRKRNEFKSSTRVGINFVITHLNYKELFELERFVRDHKIDILSLIEVENWHTPVEESFKEAKGYIKSARAISGEVRNAIKIIEGKLEKTPVELEYADSKKRKMTCRWPFDYCFITVDGFVTPCCIRSNPDIINFGNIYKEDFKTIWNGKKYREFRRTFIKNLPNSVCDCCPD